MNAIRELIQKTTTPSGWEFVVIVGSVDLRQCVRWFWNMTSGIPLYFSDLLK